MTTRKATINDLPQLSQLFDEYRKFYGKSSDLVGAEKFLSERIQNNESEIFVTEKEGKLTGFVQLYPYFSSVRMCKLWLLNDLFVDANYRGLGFSIALINEAKALCKKTNASGLFLETDKTNDIGNQLYPKTGFELQIEQNFYFWENKK